MKNSTYLIIFGLIAAGIVAWGITRPTDAADPETHESPALVEHVEGTDLSRVTLTERAAQRLDIQTTEARDEQIDGQARRVIPYSAVIYDANGNAWTYTSPEPLVYIREAITIERIDSDLAILTEGPAVGTQVVSVGGALLFGTEFGVGH
jgi:hypothetical protein